MLIKTNTPKELQTTEIKIKNGKCNILTNDNNMIAKLNKILKDNPSIFEIINSNEQRSFISTEEEFISFIE